MDIVTAQRGNDILSKKDDDDSDDNCSLMITSISGESVETKSFECGNSNSSEITLCMSMDDLPNSSNHISSSHVLSSTTASNSNRPMLSNNNQKVPSATLTSKSSPDVLVAAPGPSCAPSTNENISKKTTTNTKCTRADPMSRLVLKLEQTIDDRDKWKNKHDVLEKKYEALENASMSMLYSDD